MPQNQGLDSPTTKMLFAIQSQMPHIYAGTVPYETKLRNRKKNKASRRARALHRSRK